METLDTTKNLTGFFKHLFNFDDQTKSNLMNIVQYSLVAIIPVVAVNKTMQKYVPEADEEKGNMEILLEVILQVTLMFLGMFFIHRIIEYIPTISGAAYPEFSVVYIILASLMITLSLQTKLGEKTSILATRVSDFWNGTDTYAEKKKMHQKRAQAQGQSQGQPQGQMQMPSGGMMQQLVSPEQQAIQQSIGGVTEAFGTSNIANLPTSGGQIPDYSGMYQNTTTPIIGAVPGGDMGPMAANEMGGSFGSSLF